MLVPTLIGPTAAGKTRVAAALARLTAIEIVSADSRQVYRGLDIGTAKPAESEREAAPYHGLDLIGPSERYSAGRFAREAAGWIAAIAARGGLPLVVGGTGLYLRALFDGLFDEPEMDPLRRERLGRALGRLPAAEVARWARRLDAGFGGGGAQRASRVSEVALLTGRTLTELRQRAPGAPPRFAPWYALLTLPRAVLAQRIAARTEAMLANGLIDEVRGLLDAGVPRTAPGLTGVGYREVVLHIDGKLAGDALSGAIAIATRRYAKRQETWFRHQLSGDVVRLDASGEPESLAQEVLSRYRAALRTLEPDHAS